MKNYFLRLFLFLLGIFLIINLTRSLINLWQKTSLISQEEERLAKVKLENEELKQQLAQIQTPEYIEQQAREKLGLAREGEIVIILPPSPYSQSEKNQLPPKENLKEKEEKPIWQQWLNLLLN